MQSVDSKSKFKNRKKQRQKKEKEKKARKEQSVWSFTVKQGETSIHEDGAACKVSTSSWTMEVEAVSRAYKIL